MTDIIETAAPDVTDILAAANTTLTALKTERDGISEAMAKFFKPDDAGKPTKLEFTDDADKDAYRNLLSQLKDVNVKMQQATDSVNELDKARILSDYAAQTAQLQDANALATQAAAPVVNSAEKELKQRHLFASIVTGKQVHEISEQELVDLNAATLTTPDQQGNKRGTGFEDKATVTTSTAASPFGGYAVPVPVATMLTRLITNISPLMMEATVSGGGMADQYWPTNDESDVYGTRVAEDTDSGAQDPAFGRVLFQRFRTSSRIMEFSRKWLEATAITNVEAMINTLASERMGRIMNRDFTTNTTYGLAGRAAAGVNQARTTSLSTAFTKNNLVSLYFSLDEAYRENGNAIWMMSDQGLQGVANIEFGNADARPLFMMNYVDGFGTVPTIMGKRVRVNRDIPQVAAGAIVAYFGDFTNYRIEEVPGSMRMYRYTEQQYSTRGNVAFMMDKYDSGNLLLSETVRRLSIAS